MGLKNFFDKIEHHFTPGGKLEKWYPLFEATATVFYTPRHGNARGFART
ncbi:Na(+)-translocating NADH-quinone reductase subunit B [Serratia fonticola]|uniref:Na(+)-translocating NADH-quinone reductase subunit B n=1 Tax=Serratia fonticola TaxID=47917 RepID=A0A4U9TSW5_SERFO|nr:Na(+)-translocating NADH-quinone reductase subunit B [Serratia fonticola]